MYFSFFFFQAEDGIRDLVRSRGLGDVYKRQDNNNTNDNKEIIGKIVNLRVRRSKLLGFDTYADFVLVNNMAKTPETVVSFLQRVWDPALKVAKEELAAMQKIADAEGAGVKLESWDWWSYCLLYTSPSPLDRTSTRTPYSD